MIKSRFLFFAAVAAVSGVAEAARPVARWDVVPYQRIDGVFKAGVVAFHDEGVKVVFDVAGKKFTAEEFRSMLLTAVNDINPYMTGKVSFTTKEDGSRTLNYPDYANQMGAGYVDALKLLLQVERQDQHINYFS